MTEAVRMGTTVTGSEQEQNMRDYLLRNCMHTHLPPGTPPYMIVKSPAAWGPNTEKLLTGGRVVRIFPLETYGDYIVKRD